MRDIEIALRVVEDRLADKSRFVEAPVALVLHLGIGEIGFGLAQRLAGDRQLQLAQLPQVRLGLRHRHLCLLYHGARLARFQRDQRLARLDGLSFRDRHFGHCADDLAADIDAKRCRHATARHHRLDHIAAHHLHYLDARAEHRALGEVGDDAEGDRAAQNPPPQGP